jgi:hypothetical protein
MKITGSRTVTPRPKQYVELQMIGKSGALSLLAISTISKQKSFLISAYIIKNTRSVVAYPLFPPASLYHRRRLRQSPLRRLDLQVRCAGHHQLPQFTSALWAALWCSLLNISHIPKTAYHQ